MFPATETMSESGGTIPMERHGADITGLTPTEHILAQIAEWINNGASSTTIPNLGDAPIEPEVSLNLLRPRTAYAPLN